nr:hypothetical transcript [Hymenolepis microstoma]
MAPQRCTVDRCHTHTRLIGNRILNFRLSCAPHNCHQAAETLRVFRLHRKMRISIHTPFQNCNANSNPFHLQRMDSDYIQCSGTLPHLGSEWNRNLS